MESEIMSVYSDYNSIKLFKSYITSSLGIIRSCLFMQIKILYLDKLRSSCKSYNT